jgi:hypothetical protein
MVVFIEVLQVRGIYRAKKQQASGPRGICPVFLLSYPKVISYVQVLSSG